MKTIKSEDTPAYISSTFTIYDDEIIKQALTILNKRLERTETCIITCPQNSKDFLVLKLAELEHEVFSIMFLDNRHQLIKYEEMFRGTIDGASVYPREVIKRALQLNAAALIIAHNHPSGISEPSTADEAITLRLKTALETVDIKLLDHIIVGNTSTVSLAKRGVI